MSEYRHGQHQMGISSTTGIKECGSGPDVRAKETVAHRRRQSQMLSAALEDYVTATEQGCHITASMSTIRPSTTTNVGMSAAIFTNDACAP